MNWNSQTIFCCCNIYNLAKFLNGVEISLIIFGNILSTTNSLHGSPQWYQYLIFGMGLVYLIFEFYGILTHRCMEFSPAGMYCENRCVYCWRPMEFYDAMKMEPEQVAEPEQILRKLM